MKEQNSDSHVEIIKEAPILSLYLSDIAYQSLFQAILDGDERGESVCENALFGRSQKETINKELKENVFHFSDLLLICI